MILVNWNNKYQSNKIVPEMECTVILSYFLKQNNYFVICFNVGKNVQISLKHGRLWKYLKKTSEKNKRKELNICCYNSLLLSIIFQEVQIIASTHSSAISKRVIGLKMQGFGDKSYDLWNIICKL